jgi:hypothetical protein
MDKAEALEVLSEEMGRYRKHTYDELKALIDQGVNAYETKAASGTAYQLEIQVYWDGKAGRDVRVIGAIDDGGWRAFVPLTDDFILTADGEFIGE